MRFSVVMPVYHADSTLLAKAVASVLAQTENDWELLIVDDHELDDPGCTVTKQLQAQCTDTRVRFLYHGENRGANAARNTGIRAATGEIVAFLDADDAWHSNYLARVHQRFSQGDVGLTAAGVRRIFPEREKESIIQHAEGDVLGDLLLGDIIGPTSCVAVRREVLLAAGLFDEDLPARQDYDLWLRVCRRCRVGYIRQALVDMDCGGHERISTGGMKHIRGTEMVLEKILCMPEAAGRERAIRRSHLYYLGVRCLKDERYALARGYFRRSAACGLTLKAVCGMAASLCPPLCRAAVSMYRKLTSRGRDRHERA